MPASLRGRLGLPYLGETLAIVNHPFEFARRRYARYGPASRTRFMGKHAAILLGKEAQELVLTTADDPLTFPARPGYAFFAPILGESLLLQDGPIHSAQRHTVAPALHPRNYPAYLDRMNTAIDRVLATWGAHGQRRFHRDALEIAFRMACSIVVGLDIGDDFRALSRNWITLLRGLPTPFRLNIPGTTWGRALAARQRVDRLLVQLIAARRQQPGEDMLSLLVAERTADGQPLPDAEILAHTRMLLFAAYDTTSGVMSWILAELLRHPEALRRVGTELISTDPLTFEALRATPYTDAAIKETLRLHPVGPVLTRGVLRDVAFAGATIPAGWVVLLIPPFTGRMSDYFTDPDAFEPERFLPPREEDKAHRYAYVGFGAGAHTCLGANIAPFEVKVMLARLLRQFDLDLVPGQDLQPRYLPAARPASGTCIRYHQKAPFSGGGNGAA
jgi:cytochrome P450